MKATVKGLLCAIAALPALGAHSAFAADAPITSCDPAAFAAKYPTLAGKKIVMAVDPSTVPYAMIDIEEPNVIKGSDVELAAAAFECMGLEHEHKVGSWPGLFPSIIAGQADLMFYLFHNATRAEQGDFVTYMNAASGAIVAKGNPKNITSQDDLCGKTVSAGLGTVEERQANDWSKACTDAGNPAITVMTSTDVASGFRLIASGRADVMVSDLPLLNMMVARNPDAYEIGYTSHTSWKIGAAVANDSPLGPALHEALLLVQASGKDREIFEKYGIDTALLTASEYLPQ